MNYTKTTSFNLSTNYAVKSVMTSISSVNLLELMAKPHGMEGYIYGCKQPLCLVKLRVSMLDNQPLEPLVTRLHYYLHACSISINIPQNANDLVYCFGDVFCALQKKAGFPVFEAMQIQSLSSNEFALYLPSMDEKIFIPLTDLVLNLFNQNMACDTHNLTLLDDFLQRINQHAPQGSNSLRFLQAAYENDIPWIFVEQNTWQFGHGAKSRWFDSSFTDKTSILSTSLARNKISTARLLAKAGLPVPEQILVQHEIEAIQAARKIGFPLVMKLLDSDGGNGVFAGLYSEQAVKKAWQFLQTYTKTVLMEKQISGKDYRLQVLQGELIWAVERIPADIVGDGHSTIQMLIDAKSIAITEALQLFLEEQGYTLQQILPCDQKIRVHGIANVSAGGTPVAVFEKVHPDNKRLAETAANLLRLDMAGIDLILPDIEKSWLETTASIIEVNAQPQFGIITAPHIYKDILLTLLPEKGRIPIIVVCGTSQHDFIQSIQTRFLSHCKAIGIAKEQGAFLHDKQIASTESLFRAGKSLLLNNQVDGLIYQLEDLVEINLHGLPFDAFDHLFLLDVSLDESLAAVTLMKACKGRVITTQQLVDNL